MKLSPLGIGAGLLGAGLVGAGVLAYGCVVESNNLKLERLTLPLPFWPERLRNYRIAVLSDLHVRGIWSYKLAKRAIAMALEESPDMVLMTGDFVAFWQTESPELLGDILEPLLLMNGNAVAVPGNHDYWMGEPDILQAILDELNIKLLRNESWTHGGVTWVGVDSAIEGLAKPVEAMNGVQGPAICLWHEPDVVDFLPSGCSLMVSGHSHGGQFRFPGGWAPMTTSLGSKYVRGFFSDAPTPLYVSRGVGTTGPPSRFNCPPEVAILKLVPMP